MAPPELIAALAKARSLWAREVVRLRSLAARLVPVWQRLRARFSTARPPSLEGMPGELRGTGEHLRLSGAHRMPSLDGAGPPPQLQAGSRRKGGTFTAAPPPPREKLAPAEPRLADDQVEAMRHDSARRKDEARALAMIQKHKSAFGPFKLERLAQLPRTFAPEPLAELRAAHPELATETLEQLVPLLGPLSREICDRAAEEQDWRATLRAALLPKERPRFDAALDALAALTPVVRRKLLWLPRAPVAAEVEKLVSEWRALPATDVRAVALAMAQFTGHELRKALKEVPAPVRIAPKGLRG